MNPDGTPTMAWVTYEQLYFAWLDRVLAMLAGGM